MHVRRLFVLVALFSSAAMLSATDVLMEGPDTERTGWVRDEKVFTLANVGSTKLLWSVQLNSTPRSMHNLFPPLIAENVTTPQGPLEVGLVAGVTDDLFAINVANGQVLWRRRFENRLPNQAPVNNVLCPADRRPRPRWCRYHPASTRSMRCRGTAGCTRSTSAMARTSRRRRSSFPATANRMRSTTRTASSTRRPRRDAAA